LLLGSFLTSVLNFLVMAFVVFCLVKGLNKLHRKKEEAPLPRPGPPMRKSCSWKSVTS
jgi:large conductance mechanosensitive channel